MWKLVVPFCLLTTVASFEVVNPETFTFAILKNQKPRCLGVAVDEKYITTSAHCVYGSARSEPLMMFIASEMIHDANDSGAASSLSVKTFAKTENQGVPVTKVFVHPYYTPPSSDYDIAVLKIETTIPKPVGLKLGKTEPPPNENVDTIYWDVQNNTVSLGNATIEDRKSCKNKVGKFVSGRMICAYDKNPSLRSGGPLIFNEKLIGIPSKKIESNQGVLPAIYTNIANSEIYSFIESYV